MKLFSHKNNQENKYIYMYINIYMCADSTQCNKQIQLENLGRRSRVET